MSDSFCTIGSLEAAGSLNTRWGTFNVDYSSSASDSSDYNLSWARDHHSSPKSAASQELPTFPRCQYDDAGENEEGPELGSTSASGAHSVASSEQFSSNQVMVKNILNRFTKKEFLEFLDSVGLKGTYNGAYLPVGRTRKGKTSNLGYAFVDFKGMAEVALCRSLLEGLVVGCPGQQKQIEIAPVTTNHPTRKFQKNPKKTKEEQSPSGIDTDFATCGTFDLALEQPSSYQAAKAVASPARAPPGLELPAFCQAPASPAVPVMGRVDGFFSFPQGDFDECLSQFRIPQACDQEGNHFRHLPGLPSSYRLEASFSF